MKHTIAILTVFLAGCTTVPVTVKFPEVPRELTESCQELKKVEGDKVLMTDLLEVVVENYTLFHKCSIKNEAWNEWYKKQKELYNSLN